ncbi:MAG TPA: glycine betaine ABC transporter substrate-binding protein, partial [Candidatus Angelobacter sp.]|nr:glycine betaine ABC transporter substrate-binding protein [Candidatus Angelobacter sp.]
TSLMDRRSFLSGLALLLCGCVPKASGITIGSKNFTEQLVLGEILAQQISRSTRLPVNKRFYLAGTYICHQALLSGRIDMYVEYTGTALVAILKEPPLADHEKVFTKVKDFYARKFGLEVLPSLGFDNTFAMVMRGNDARRLNLKTLSDAAKISSQLRLGVGYEFMERADGYKGLVSKYGLKFAESPRVMDLGLLYRALQNNQVDMVAGSNTDGLIAALDLVVLEDDLHYFPPYDAVPIVRRDTLQKYPELGKALEQLSGRISVEDMRKLNYAVDGEKKDAAEVVKEMLDQKHFSSGT